MPSMRTLNRRLTRWRRYTRRYSAPGVRLLDRDPRQTPARVLARLVGRPGGTEAPEAATRDRRRRHRRTHVKTWREWLAALLVVVGVHGMVWGSRHADLAVYAFAIVNLTLGVRLAIDCGKRGDR